MRTTNLFSDLNQFNVQSGRSLKFRREPEENFSTSSNSLVYFNLYAPLSLYFVSSGQVEFYVNENRGVVCHESEFIIVNKGDRVRYEVKDTQSTEIFTFCFLKNVADLEIVRNGLPQSAKYCFLGSAVLEVLKWLAPNVSTLKYQFIECDEELNFALCEHVKHEQLLTQRVISHNRNTRLEVFNKICKAREFILENLMNSISLERIASEIGMSKYHFSRCFSAVFLVPPHKYMLEMKLQLAMKLITCEEMPLAEIPDYLQFTDFAYFSNQFKQRFGVRPSILIKDQISKRRQVSLRMEFN